MSLVAVDDDDLLGRPAEGDGPLAQGVLAGGGLGVVEHLAQGGLAHVEIGGRARDGRR